MCLSIGDMFFTVSFHVDAAFRRHVSQNLDVNNLAELTLVILNVG